VAGAGACALHGSAAAGAPGTGGPLEGLPVTWQACLAGLGGTAYVGKTGLGHFACSWQALRLWTAEVPLCCLVMPLYEPGRHGVA